MLKSPVSKTDLRKDIDFSVDGYMSPTFYNIGNTPASVHGVVIEPGNFLKMEFPHIALQGSIEIRFITDDVTTPQKHVIVHYVTYRETKTKEANASNC
jgi:hypothetical protein